MKCATRAKATLGDEQLLLAAHKLLGTIDHFLLLLGIILILTDKALVWNVHGLLDCWPLLNALHPLLNVRHVIDLHTYSHSDSGPKVTILQVLYCNCKYFTL